MRDGLSNKKVVHCHGVFDLLHIGHIKHFKQAKDFGDLLVVTITPDHFVNKGPGHPAFSQELRAEAVAALGCTDYVIINKWPTAIEIINVVRPTYYVKGDEYKNTKNDLTGKISDEAAAVKAVGGEIRFTTDITYSSSNLINKYIPSFPDHVQKWLMEFSQKYSADDINTELDNLSDLKVLVVGEVIIDEYHYCTTMGKSGKEPVLASRYDREDRHAGGVLAVANHIAAFTKHVDVVSFLGNDRRHEDFIHEKLYSNTTTHFFEKENSPTLVKRRFVENHLNSKLFEVYEMNDQALSKKEEDELIKKIDSLIPNIDMIIVTDYGHGIITPRVAQFLSDNAPYLVVNTQANAGNQGMNTILKYSNADFATMTGKELSLEVRHKGNDKDHIRMLCSNFQTESMLVTAGSAGLLLYEVSKGFSEAPAFAAKVTDRVGAGDTVLALTALLMYKKAPSEMICFLGNVVGAQAVTIMGNSKFLEKNIVKKHISHLLK